MSQYVQRLGKHEDLITKDVERVQSQIKTILAMSPALARDKLIMIEQLASIHTISYLTESEKLETFILQFTKECIRRKQIMTQELLKRLRQVVFLQTLVSMITMNLEELTDAIAQQSDHFDHLLHAHRVAIAYVFNFSCCQLNEF